MIASTTQDTLVNSNRNLQKKDLPFIRTASMLEPEDFNNYIQQEYGAFWEH